MTSEGSVLILGEHGSAINDLASRARAMGFSVVRAKMPLDAIELARSRGEQLGAVLIDPDLPVPDLASVVEALASELAIPRTSIIAAGIGAESLEPADASAIERVLRAPVEDNVLRFELNRALSGDQLSRPRSSERAPMGWQVRVYQGGRVKNASVYSLSNGGAYLETPRPAMRGAHSSRSACRSRRASTARIASNSRARSCTRTSRETSLARRCRTAWRSGSRTRARTTATSSTATSTPAVPTSRSRLSRRLAAHSKVPTRRSLDVMQERVTAVHACSRRKW